MFTFGQTIKGEGNFLKVFLIFSSDRKTFQIRIVLFKFLKKLF